MIDDSLSVSPVVEAINAKRATGERGRGPRVEIDAPAATHPRGARDRSEGDIEAEPMNIQPERATREGRSVKRLNILSMGGLRLSLKVELLCCFNGGLLIN